MRVIAKYFLICFLVANASVAHADSKAAKVSYDRGIKQYNLGHFAEAISEFEKAYELEPAPVLLFNIAQSHRQLGNNERAVFFYRRYLESAPQSANRADVEKRIADLQEVLQKERDAKGPPIGVEPRPVTGPNSGGAPSVTAASRESAPGATGAASDSGGVPEGTVTARASAPETSTSGRHLRLAGIITGAVGVAAIATGIVFGAAASSKSDSVASAPVFNSADDSAGHRDATMQWVFYGVGAAAVVGGAALYYFGWREDVGNPKVSLIPLVGPAGAGATLRASF